MAGVLLSELVPHTYGRVGLYEDLGILHREIREVLLLIYQDLLQRGLFATLGAPRPMVSLLSSDDKPTIRRAWPLRLYPTGQSPCGTSLATG